jgi:hypothetical protein
MIGAGVEILGGDGDRHAQIGHDELHGGLAAALCVVFMEQQQFFFFGEIGVPADFRQILLQAGNGGDGLGISRPASVGLRDIQHNRSRFSLDHLVVGRIENFRFQRALGLVW